MATFRPAVATSREMHMIDVRKGEPYQFMEETLYSAADMPLVVLEISVNDNYIKYAVTRRMR